MGGKGKGWRKLRRIGKKATRKHLEVRQANITYHDIAAHTYEQDVEESGHQNKFNQERIEGIIRDLSQNCVGQRFLDIGCGTGNVLKFGKKYFQHAVGIDVSLNMLKLANARGMEVIQADALFLPFVANVFGVVSVFSVLHHVYDYPRIIRETARVLKKGGFLYSDWEPNKRPLTLIEKNRLSWKMYLLLSFSYRCLSFLAVRVRNPVKKSVKKQNNYVNLRETMPEIREIYRLAEWHNLKPAMERGIDFEAMRENLIANGFTDICPTFHEAGKLFSQLSLTHKIGLSFLSTSSDLPGERFMENIQIIARKDRLYNICR